MSFESQGTGNEAVTIPENEVGGGEQPQEIQPPQGDTSPAPLPVPEGSVDYNAYDVSELGDSTLTHAVETMRRAFPTLDINRAIGKALDTGDPHLIDQYYLREVGGAHADILEGQARLILDRVASIESNITNEAHELAGGKERWDTVTHIFNSKAPQHLRDMVKGALDRGGPQNYKAAIQTVLDFARQGGHVPQPNQRFDGAQGGNQNSLEPLSQADYIHELSKLRDLPKAERYLKEDQLARRRVATAQRGQ